MVKIDKSKIRQKDIIEVNFDKKYIVIKQHPRTMIPVKKCSGSFSLSGLSYNIEL